MNCKGLAAAILQLAAKDYQRALKKNNETAIAYFEKWFVSDWAQLLSDDMGEIIMKKCREEVVKNRLPMRRRRKNENDN